MISFNAYWHKWLNKRIPAASQHRLNHNNIFIFPAKFGGLFVLLCLLLFLLGTNYQNNLMLLLCYFLVALFLVNLLASYINFARLDIQIGKCPEVFVGDNLHLPLWLNTDHKSISRINGLLYFKFNTGNHSKVKKTKRLFAAKKAVEIDVDSFSNPINLSHQCHTRGKLALPRVSIESFYPLGLYRCWTHLAFTHHIIVFPKPLPCDINLHLAQQSSTSKNTDKNLDMANQNSGHEDFSHLKAYQLGESLHHVAWKQLAKGRGMVSKQFDTTSQQIGWLKLATQFKTLSSYSSNAALETNLGQLCYQVIELSRSGKTFGLDLGKNCIVPNSGEDHRQACLKALACFPNGNSSK